MDIRCERCRAEYRFKDDAIGSAGLTVRCSKCGHVFKVRRPTGPSALPAAEAGWTLRKKRTGDVYAVADLTQLQRWVTERRAIRDDEASVAGGPWRRLADIPELGAAFAVALAARKSAAGRSEISPPGAGRREALHTTSVFPGPGRPPEPARTEIAYKVPDPGGESTEPAWAQPSAGEGPAMTPLFSPGMPDEDRPRIDRDPAFAEPEPTLRDGALEPERGALPLTGAAPLVPPEPPPLSALIDEGPPPTRTAPRPRRTSTFARVLGTLAVLITLVALASVAVAYFKPEWLDPFFAGLDGGLGRKTSAPRPADAPPVPPPSPVPGTRAETPAPSKPQGAPAGASDSPASTPSTSVPGTDQGTTASAQSGGTLSGSNTAPPATQQAAPENPSSAAPAPAPVAAGPAVPGTAAVPSSPAPGPIGGAAAPAPSAGSDGSVPGPAGKPAAAPAPAVQAKPVPGTGVANAAGEGPGAGPKPAPAGESAPSTADAASAVKAIAPAPPAAPVKAAPPKLTGAAAQLAQARSLRARGRAESALDVYGQILAKDPQNADALAGRGLAYFDLGRTSKAEEAFKAALAADAKNGDALLGLAETYRYDSRREDALAYYEKYLEAHPRGPGATIARANIQALKE